MNNNSLSATITACNLITDPVLECQDVSKINFESIIYSGSDNLENFEDCSESGPWLLSKKM